MSIDRIKYLITGGINHYRPRRTDDGQKHTFIHIPKTAGNSFMQLIYANVPQSEVYPNYYEKTIINKSHYVNRDVLMEKHATLLQGRSWLMGHISVDIAKSIWANTKLYCFFREPKARIISNLLHLQHKDERFREMSLREIYDKHGKLLRWQQANFMGFKPHKQNINEAKQAIRNLDFIGITERYSQSIQLLTHQLNWQNTQIQHKNVGNYQASSEEVEAMRAFLEREQIIDTVIYQTALDEFEHRLSDLRL